MAPWPEQGNEPKAPDKSCSKGVESNPSDSSKVDSGTQEDPEAKATLGKTDDRQNRKYQQGTGGGPSSGCVPSQEDMMIMEMLPQQFNKDESAFDDAEEVDDKNSGVSELDDGQLRALLDEAITYKCPKDREGKSNLFKELLEEVEAESDGGEESNPPPFGIVDQCRIGKRRRRDAAVSERQTRGGSLQNIVQAYSDFESVYFGNRGKKSLGGGRRKGEFCHYGLGPGSSGGGACGRGGGGACGGGTSGGGSVSARQREGGSLPCNVNAGGVGGGGGGVGGGCGGGGLPASECPFEGVVRRRRSEQRVSWEQDNEDVMPAHMDRGGGGGAVAAAPPPPDVVVTSGRPEAGSEQVGEVEKGGGAGSSPSEGPCESLMTVIVGGEGVTNGVLEGTASRNGGHSEGVKTDGVVESPASVELMAQCCATLLSSAVDDGSGDGVELRELHGTEDRDGRSKSKGETCRSTPSRGAPEVPGFCSEPSITASVPVASSSPASSSASDRKVRREVMRGDSVDTVVPFSLQLDEKKPLLTGSSGSMTLDLTKGLVNGMETAPLQLPSTYPSVNSVVGSSTSPVSSTSESMATLASSSSASSHSGCGDSHSSQPGILEDRNSVCGPGKEMAMRKQQLGESQTKPVMPMQGTYSMSIPGHHLSVLTYPPNNWISSPDSVSRINFHGSKDLNDVKSKSLDENGNAVTMSQGLTKDVHEKSKGKSRRPKTNNDRNPYILSQSIEGFRGDQDLDCLLKFIGTDEEKKSKNTNNGAVERVRRSNFRRESDRSSVSNDVGSGGRGVKSARDRNGASEDKEDINACNSTPTTGDKGSTGSKVGGRTGGGSRQQQQIQRSGKMKKSNSLEEISKTKSEDLTVSGPKMDQESLKKKELAANPPVIDNNIPKQAKEVLQNSFGTNSKPDSVESCTKEEDISNHNDKLIKGDHNGNSETGSKPGVISAAKTLLSATSFKEDFYAVTDASPQVLEETEFHVVTKKQRRKKRRTGAVDGGPIEGRSARNSRDGYSYSGGGGGNGDRTEEFKRVDRSDGGGRFEGEGDESVWDGGGGGGDGRFLGSYRRHHRRHRSQRSGDRLKSTSSVPPSEHSGESSDDSDSVHSLPVSSSVPRPPVDPSSTSSGSTPQASYADIARMAFSATMPVITGSQGNSASGNLVPSVLSTQKSKTAPATALSPGQVSFPPVSSTNSSGTSSMPYIGSAKLNIGAPPVSGSKASSPSVPAGETSIVSVASPTPKSESQVTPSEDHDKTPETDALILTLHNPVLSPQSLNEPRKKDAMTCTTLDGKTVSSNYTSTVVSSSQSKVEIDTPAQNLSPNTPNILEDYYPSLQESLHEKTERRNGKLGQHQTPLNKVSPLEEKRIPKSAAPIPSAPFTSENKVSEVETVINNNTNIVSISHCGEKTPVPPSVEKPLAPAVVKTKEPSVTATRIKGSGKKPGFRSLPPVVIMDHHYRQDGASKEGAVGDSNEIGGTSSSGFNSADIGGFTFGFEVNEELLALSSGDTSAIHETSSPPDVDVEKKPNGNPSLGDEESELLPAPPPPATSPLAPHLQYGKDPIPVFRSPGELDTKRFNYEKIVSFIGLSWEDVLKEMSVPVKHTGSRVQYYGGQ